MKNGLAYLFLMLTAVACTEKQAGISNDFDEGRALAELQDERLREVSGLASSMVNTGMFWAHNDSGNDPEIFLLDEQLNIKMTCRLLSVNNRDWEDVSVGPGPDSSKSYVYVGEIGDNKALFPLKKIYRFEEPMWNDSVGEVVIKDFDTSTFSLSDGAKDTESMMIDPQSGNIYVISKRESPVHVYEIAAPFSSPDTIIARNVMPLPFTRIVAADYRRGEGILIKNYESIYYWPGNGEKGLLDLLKGSPLQVPYVEEPQGESICWAHDGSGFYTISERKKKKQSFLYWYSMRK